MIPTFKELVGSLVILRNSRTGIYHQSVLYELDGVVYARAKGGFIKLYGNGSSSHAYTGYTLIDGGIEELTKDKMGRLIVKSKAQIDIQENPKKVARLK